MGTELQLKTPIDGTDALSSDMARALLTKADPEDYAARLLGQFKAGFGAK
ncbi:hypothetical protein IV454_07305 [Massilia antarctica]|uniref:Uncharacterized protein n=1 Tax=Massilia antarctica TaxID=2765360 RepID=A0AA48WFZ6_9BURK|nr:hypothetical protein [Massilia antarctica]QPI51321.1 hypothetical protein IV454_07305 [Massilia antarctica]